MCHRKECCSSPTLGRRTIVQSGQESNVSSLLSYTVTTRANVRAHAMSSPCRAITSSRSPFPMRPWLMALSKSKAAHACLDLSSSAWRCHVHGTVTASLPPCATSEPSWRHSYADAFSLSLTSGCGFTSALANRARTHLAAIPQKPGSRSAINTVCGDVEFHGLHGCTPRLPHSVGRLLRSAVYRSKLVCCCASSSSRLRMSSSG